MAASSSNEAVGEDESSSKHAPPMLVPAQPVIAVEHPCIIKNIDKGIKSLGGAEKLSQVSSVASGSPMNTILVADDPLCRTSTAKGLWPPHCAQTTHLRKRYCQIMSRRGTSCSKLLSPNAQGANGRRAPLAPFSPKRRFRHRRGNKTSHVNPMRKTQRRSPSLYMDQTVPMLTERLCFAAFKTMLTNTPLNPLGW